VLADAVEYKKQCKAAEHRAKEEADDGEATSPRASLSAFLPERRASFARWFSSLSRTGLDPSLHRSQYLPGWDTRSNLTWVQVERLPRSWFQVDTSQEIPERKEAPVAAATAVTTQLPTGVSEPAANVASTKPAVTQLADASSRTVADAAAAVVSQSIPDVDPVVAVDDRDVSTSAAASLLAPPTSSASPSIPSSRHTSPGLERTPSPASPGGSDANGSASSSCSGSVTPANLSRSSPVIVSLRLPKKPTPPEKPPKRRTKPKDPPTSAGATDGEEGEARTSDAATAPSSALVAAAAAAAAVAVAGGESAASQSAPRPTPLLQPNLLLEYSPSPSPDAASAAALPLDWTGPASVTLEDRPPQAASAMETELKDSVDESQNSAAPDAAPDAAPVPSTAAAAAATAEPMVKSTLYRTGRHGSRSRSASSSFDDGAAASVADGAADPHGGAFGGAQAPSQPSSRPTSRPPSRPGSRAGSISRGPSRPATPLGPEAAAAVLAEAAAEAEAGEKHAADWPVHSSAPSSAPHSRRSSTDTNGISAAAAAAAVPVAATSGAAPASVAPLVPNGALMSLPAVASPVLEGNEEDELP